MSIHTENDLERAMSRAGSHFLDRDTKRFFKSRVLWIIPVTDSTVVFTTSEKPPHGPREHAVRYWDGESVETIRKGLSSSAQAYKAAKTLVKNLKVLEKMER
jgi:hypothetical protein